MILTVRLIRSFEHGNVRPIVIKDVQLEMTVADFQQMIMEHVNKQTNLPPPVVNYAYDTMKIQHKAHGAKTNDPIINTENDEQLILKRDRSLKESGIENETEVSFFKMEDYKKYKAQLVND